MKLVIAPSFRTTLAALRAAPPQSLLLSGSDGSGLATLARSIAGHNLVAFIEPSDVKNQPDHQSGTISVEMIRQLYDQTKSKSTTRQFVIIDDADRMSSGAQNAFLKLLEEPPEATHFILTSHHPDRLLVTVRSRLQDVHVPPISLAASQQILDSYPSLTPAERQQILFIAEGRPSMMHRLAATPEAHQELVKAMQAARAFFSASNRYDRLMTCLSYASNRQSALAFCDACMLIIKHQLTRQPAVDLLDRAEQIIDAREAIDHNANPRLQLGQLVVQ